MFLLFEICKIAVGFLWLSLPGDYRVTDEALLKDLISGFYKGPNC